MSAKTSIDISKIGDLLQASCRLEVLASTDSTSDAVLRMAQAAVSSEGAGALTTPFAVISTVQTAGRGRLGRQWTSPPGGLYLSVLLKLDLPTGPGGMDSLTALSPLAALAVCESLQGFSRGPVSIKWPNDVITVNGKLVGILVEYKTLKVDALRGDGKMTGCVIFGIGVNVNRPESGGFERAAYLDDAPACATQERGEAGIDVECDLECGRLDPGHDESGSERESLSPEHVAAAVVESLLKHFDEWRLKDRSFAPFTAAYRANLSQLGSEVSIWNGRGEEIVTGKVTGIDDNGRLLVARPSVSTGAPEIIPVSAGEVTLRQPHPEKVVH